MTACAINDKCVLYIWILLHFRGRWKRAANAINNSLNRHIGRHLGFFWSLLALMVFAVMSWLFVRFLLVPSLVIVMARVSLFIVMPLLALRVLVVSLENKRRIRMIWKCFIGEFDRFLMDVVPCSPCRPFLHDRRGVRLCVPCRLLENVDE